MAMDATTSTSGCDYRMLCEALEESNELLQEENQRLKTRNRVLMSLKSQLRRKIEALMVEKDQLFLLLCAEPASQPATAVSQADGFTDVEDNPLD